MCNSCAACQSLYKVRNKTYIPTVWMRLCVRCRNIHVIQIFLNILPFTSLIFFTLFIVNNVSVYTYVYNIYYISYKATFIIENIFFTEYWNHLHSYGLCQHKLNKYVYTYVCMPVFIYIYCIYDIFTNVSKFLNAQIVACCVVSFILSFWLINFATSLF